MSEDRPVYAGATAREASATRLGRGIGAALICEDLGITDPASELPLLIEIATAAAVLQRAAASAVAGDDIGAYVGADNALRALIARRVVLRGIAHAGGAITPTGIPT